MVLLRWLFYTLVCCVLATRAAAQAPDLPGQPIGLNNAPQRDTSKHKMTKEWDDTRPVIRAGKAFEAQTPFEDTSINSLHRPQLYSLPYRDLGNLGSAAQWILWQPTLAQAQPAFGYPVFDAYRFSGEDMLYFNTTRPYSVFSYRMGSKLEQSAEILHTQNIRPQWNFAARYRKLTSPGFYRGQRTNHDNASLSSHYQSKNLRYEVFGNIVFNNFQQDENGGIVSAEMLTENAYTDRETVPTRISSANYSTRRSPVFNTLRDGQLTLRHAYTFGPIDTLYNEDSTRIDLKLRPRFRLQHELNLGSARHIYDDLRPDSSRYGSIYPKSFSTNDSVYSLQRHEWTDNRFLLQTFVGKAPLLLSAGAGIRTDKFTTETPLSKSSETLLNTYLAGTLTNEGTDTPRTWRFRAQGIFFVAGPAIGNLDASGSIARSLGRDLVLQLDFRQQIGDAPYAFRHYENAFFRRDLSFAKETFTRIGGGVAMPRRALSASFHSLLVGNYLYHDSLGQALQQGGVFQVLQAVVKKQFRFRKWVWNNEIILQQRNGDGPLNLPLYSGRHSIAYERTLFRDAIATYTGLEARYNTPWNADGYSPLLNRFYHQSAEQISNPPELTAFFSFRVKHFRLGLSADQLQQLVIRKNVVRYLHYPAQDFNIRLNMSWGLVN